MRRLLLLLLLVLAAPARAADDPDLDALLDAHAAAMGLSRDEPDSLALHVLARVEGLGLSGHLETWYEAPYRSTSRLDLGPLSLETGHDGREAWILDRNGQVRAAEAAEEAGAVLEGLVHSGAYVLRRPPLMLWRERLPDDAEGRPRLSLRILGARPWILTLDPVTLRPVASSWDDGQNVVRTRYARWREVEGRWVPFRSRVEPAEGISLLAVVTRAERVPPRGEKAYGRPAAGRNGVVFRGGGDSGRLVMHADHRHILLRARLDDRHEGLFLLDTGAGSSILNAAHLPRLGITPEGVLRATGAGGEADGALVAVESLRLGRMELPAQSWVSLDLSAMEPWLGGEVLGVLGYDTLSRAVVEVDYDRGWVRFHPPGSFRPPRGAVPVPVRLDQNIPTIEVEIEGRRAWVHVDTGSDNHLDLNGPYVRREGLLEGREGLTETGTLGLGGRAPALRGRLARLELAGFRFEDLPVNFNQAEEGVFANREIAGVLGAGVLRSFHLALDYSRRTLWLRAGALDPGP